MASRRKEKNQETGDSQAGDMDRRKLLKESGLAGASLILLSSLSSDVLAKDPVRTMKAAPVKATHSASRPQTIEKVMQEASYIPEDTVDSEQKYVFKSDVNEIDELKKMLQKAVETEDYEKAAQLRDQIKKLELGS